MDELQAMEGIGMRRRNMPRRQLSKHQILVVYRMGSDFVSVREAWMYTYLSHLDKANHASSSLVCSPDLSGI